MSIRVTLRLRRPSGWSRRGRLIFLLIFAVAISLGARTLFGDKGLLEWWRLQDEADRLEQEVGRLRADLDEERGAVLDLRKGNQGVERIARERLGMIRPGEVVYMLPTADAMGAIVADESGVSAEGESLDTPGGE